MSTSSILSSLFNSLHYYTTSHPTISNFTWSPSHSPLSSLTFLISTILTYLSLTLLLLHHYPLITLSPPLFNLLSSLHNSILLLLSLVLSLSTSLSSLLTLPSLSHVFCFPLNQTPTPSGPVFFWAYIFYLSKLYELLDTFFILTNPRKTKPITFLHVYHHSVVILMCYIWLRTRQSLMPVALVTNASVHVVMYSYYLSSSVGLRWSMKWKKVVTRVQIWQFVASFLLSGVFLWMHFVGGGCEGVSGWLFNAVFNASLLVLFLNFQAKAYRERKRD